MSFLGLAILSWCLICTTNCVPSQGSSFRVYDSGRETSLYQGPVNYHHEGPNLSSYIVTSRPEPDANKEVETVYMGSKKPIWEDDPLDLRYTKYENNYPTYEDAHDDLTFHDLECNPGSTIPCSTVINIDETFGPPPIKSTYEINNNLHDVYLEDISNSIDEKLTQPSKNYNTFNANRIQANEYLNSQFTPNYQTDSKTEAHRVLTPTPSYENYHSTRSPNFIGRYDPFAFQQNLKTRKKGNFAPGPSTQRKRYEEPPAVYQQEPPTYHSHYTDSRFFAPSVPSVVDISHSKKQLPVSERRISSSFNPSRISPEAPVMRNSITWKSHKHRDKHIKNNMIDTSNTFNKNKHYVKTNDYNDYDWNLGWDDSKIDRRQSYLALSSNNKEHYTYPEQTNASPYPSRPSSYYFPASTMSQHEPTYQRPISRPHIGSSSGMLDTSNENRRHYFPVDEDEQQNYPNADEVDSPYNYPSKDNSFYGTYSIEKDPIIIQNEKNGFLEIEPAVVNTGYVVSDDIQPPQEDEMWSSYDERYGWTESSSRRPEMYHTTTAIHDVMENVDPIKTWTSLDIAKPEWEKRDEKTDIGTSTSIPFDETPSYDDYNEPYGKWDTPLKLNSVPFSRSTDGKPIRWKLITSTSNIRGGSNPQNSTEAIARPSVPLIVVRPKNSNRRRVWPTLDERKNTKSRRISKRMKYKGKRKRKFGRRRTT